MAKKITFNEEAIKSLTSGIDKVAEAVKITLGPKGKLVCFNRGVGPIFTIDGVTVAKQIELEDEGELDGAELIKGAARETDKIAGDGTTTATILTQSILKQGLKALSAGIDFVKMSEGISSAVSLVKSEISKVSKKIKTKQEISDVATISSRDREVGDIIAEITDKLGKEAIVSVEESQVFGLNSEIVKGLKIDKGFVSPYMITNQERGEVILDKPYILVTSQVISNNQDIIKILNAILATENRTLLIISDTVKGEALATIIINKLQGRVLCVAVNAPGMGDDKTEQLKDIAFATGAEFISEEIGKKVEDAELSDLGRAEKVVITQKETVIIGGAGNLKKRIALIESELKNEKSDYKKELKEMRLAKLKGRIAVIRVGTVSGEENAEKRYRIEDAVRSAKSSLEEGIVPGAGMTLYSISGKIDKKLESNMDLSYRTGMKIVADAIKEPARQIIANTGKNPDVILAECERLGMGYDSNNGKFVDLLKEGIIDPAKVVRVAIENAVSKMSLVLRTGALITEVVKENANNKTETSG